MSIRIAGRAIQYGEVLGAAVAVAGLYGAHLFDPLLFYVLIEVFATLLAFNIFVFSWNTRRYQEGSFLTLIGFGALFSAALNLVHALTSGMGMFPSYGANLSPQLFIASQAVWSVTLFLAPFFIHRTVNTEKSVAAYAAITATLLAVIFLQLLPASYSDNGAPTLFMNISGVTVALIYQAAIAALLWQKREFPTPVRPLLISAVAAASIAALITRDDALVSSPLDYAQHIIKLLSYYLMYRAIMLSGFDEPLKLQDRIMRQREEDLLKSEARFRRLVDANIIGIITIDEEKIIDANDIFLAMTGYSRADLEVGALHWKNMTPPEYVDLTLRELRELDADGASTPFEKEYIRKDGSRVPVLIGSALIERSPMKRICFVIDLSERKQAEREREIMLAAVDQMRFKAEQRADELAAILSTLTEPVVIYNMAGEIVHANQAAYSLQGFDPFLIDTASKKTILQMRSRDGKLLAPNCQPAARALNGETIVSESLIICDIQGKDIIGHVSAAPFSSGGVLQGAIVVWHDITELERTRSALQQAHDELETRVLGRTAELATANRLLQAEIKERMMAERELVESREQLRNLSLHLQSVLEREREKIAREIHDELGQSLTAIKLDLSWLHDRYADHDGLLKKINSMIGLINMSITSVKRISSELRPAILDHLGLAAAVEWQMKEFIARTGIACDLVINPDDLMVDRDRSTALFRILQETLTNVIRHAAASKVMVSLNKTDGQVTLQVKDNGRGITQEQRVEHNAFGLMGIQERVLSLNGEVSIAGKPDEGTLISVRIPLDRDIAGV